MATIRKVCAGCGRELSGSINLLLFPVFAHVDSRESGRTRVPLGEWVSSTLTSLISEAPRFTRVENGSLEVAVRGNIVE
ncbi:MAG: hypothetical protein DMG70_24615 [Acidobacteria bacterium]|nr:MAG: hypothetical protein DMG70_24615 [Acidobacteriota bacterium]